VKGSTKGNDLGRGVKIRHIHGKVGVAKVKLKGKRQVSRKIKKILRKKTQLFRGTGLGEEGKINWRNRKQGTEGGS